MPAPEEAFAAMALVEGLAVGAPVGFALLDDTGRIALTSASMPAGLHAELASGARDVIATGHARHGVELRAAGGRRLVVSLHPLEHEGRRMVGAIAVDITTRAETEDAVRASEHALATAQRMAHMGWWIVWFESRAAEISPELVDLLGLDPALLGREATEAWLAAVVDEDRAALLAAGRRSALTGEPLDVRYRLRHPDGALRTVHARGDVVRGAEGEVVAIGGFAQDVSDWAAAAERQRAVAELGRDALGDLPVGELLDRVAATVAATLGFPRCAALELEPNGRELATRSVQPPWDAFPATLPAGDGSFAGFTLRLRRPVVVDDWSSETRFDAHLGVALGLGSGACVVVGGAGDPAGVLMAVSEAPGRFSEEDIGFLQSMANVLAEGIERRRAAAEIADLAAARGRLVAQALDAEERARRSMSESLHDGALQEILAAGHDLYVLGDDPAAERAREQLRDIVARLRAVMVALHPTVLTYGGLEAALEAVARQQGDAGGFTTELEVDAEAVGVRDDLVLSIARELLTNVARHAGARRVELSLRRTPQGVVLEVADDGAGMPAGRHREAQAEGHIGLATSAERVAAVGGRLRVSALPGGGTWARADLPAS